MSEDLTVAAGTTIVLGETAPPQFAGSVERVRIRTLQDLVDNGVIESRAALDTLLDAAKDITAQTLRSRETFTPFVPVIGTARPDLRRFGGFLAATGDAHPAGAQMFWRIARTIEPRALAGVTPHTELVTVGPYVSRDYLTDIFKYLFRDITIEPNSTLAVAPAVKVLTCSKLLIKRGGRILVQGGGVKITADSIQGEQ